MRRKGIEFSLRQVEADLWKWQFQIGDTVRAGQTRSRLMGMAAHRVHTQIDAELRKQGNVIQHENSTSHDGTTQHDA